MGRSAWFDHYSGGKEKWSTVSWRPRKGMLGEQFDWGEKNLCNSSFCSRNSAMFSKTGSDVLEREEVPSDRGHGGKFLQYFKPGCEHLVLQRLANSHSHPNSPLSRVAGADRNWSPTAPRGPVFPNDIKWALREECLVSNRSATVRTEWTAQVLDLI